MGATKAKTTESPGLLERRTATSSHLSLSLPPPPPAETIHAPQKPIYPEMGDSNGAKKKAIGSRHEMEPFKIPMTLNEADMKANLRWWARSVAASLINPEERF